MLKNALCSLALLTALSALVCSPAVAQDRAQTPVPAVSDRVSEAPSPGKWVAPLLVPHPMTPPSYCNPCLFYEGDLNPSARNAQGFANENTAEVPDTTTFARFRIPNGQRWKVTGLITNDLSNGGVIDPKEATWSISMGMSPGAPGTVVASGKAPATITPTGRSAFGFTEYTVSVTIPAVTLPGGYYWMSVVPQCTNANDGGCFEEFFLSDTDLTNHYGPPAQRYGDFFNSSYFGYTYAPLCSVNPDGCEFNSIGIVGTAQ